MAGPQSAPPDLPGFTYLDWLGSGGFADVFSYNQDDLDREVAVKVLLADLPDEAAELFASEINLMAKLSSHPSIVSVFQAGVAGDGRPFLVMELCPPPTLRGRLRREPFDVAKTLEIGIQIASAVETSHRLGVVHRDIKPSNILFTEYGRAALTDFGISIPTSAVPTNETAYSVAWAPPEQIRNQPLVPATDIYSLGGTLWAMLAGHSPFESLTTGNDYESIQRRNLYDPVPALGRGDVPESLERALARALDKDPLKRQPSALDFARQLQQVQAELDLPRTTIDVRVDAVHRAKATAEAHYEGTQVASFEPSQQQGDAPARPVTASAEPRPQPRTPAAATGHGTQFWLPLTQGDRPSWWADDRTGGYRIGPHQTGSQWAGGPTNQRPGGWPGGPQAAPRPQNPAQQPWSGGGGVQQLPPLALEPVQPRAGLSNWAKAVLIAVGTFLVMMLFLLLAL